MPDQPKKTYELHVRIEVDAADLPSAQLAIGEALLRTVGTEPTLADLLSRVRVKGPEHGLN